LSSRLLQNIPEGRYMGDRRTLLLIDDDPAHAKVFREALAEARDGPFEVNGLEDVIRQHEHNGEENRRSAPPAAASPEPSSWRFSYIWNPAEP
jgi:hypothetical protein